MDSLRLQNDINNIRKWREKNRLYSQLYFNNKKCYLFSIYRDHTAFINTSYSMGSHVIKRKEEICDLGLWVDRWFHLGHHIELTTRKCRQLVGCIKHYSNGNFTMETQRILYMAYVRSRSRLEFASTIWNPSAAVYKNDNESIQKQFVIHLLDNRRNATTYRLAPCEERCKQVKLQNLEVRKKAADAVMAYDIYKGNITDNRISSMFIHNDSEYGLRNSTLKLLKEPRFSTRYLSNQPIARLMRLINEYEEIARSCENRFTFKRRIMEELGLDE